MLLDFLFPRHSLSGEEGMWISDSELRLLKSSPVILERTFLDAHKLEFLDRIVAAADYDKVPLLKKAVHILKYKKVRGVAEGLGQMLVEASEHIQNDSVVLCPVPLHWIRRCSRGFNQAELLAKIVARERRWSVKNLLQRYRWTGSQVGRKREARLKGVRDAFRIRSIDLPQRVILVDDLSTTGATLNMCAKALKKAGVERVEGLVLAMG